MRSGAETIHIEGRKAAKVTISHPALLRSSSQSFLEMYILAGDFFQSAKVAISHPVAVTSPIIIFHTQTFSSIHFSRLKKNLFLNYYTLRWPLTWVGWVGGYTIHVYIGKGAFPIIYNAVYTSVTFDLS